MPLRRIENEPTVRCEQMLLHINDLISEIPEQVIGMISTVLNNQSDAKRSFPRQSADDSAAHGAHESSTMRLMQSISESCSSGEEHSGVNL